MAIVKADAYGHGAVPVAREALASGADWLGVTFPEEGLALSCSVEAPTDVAAPRRVGDAGPKGGDAPELPQRGGIVRPFREVSVRAQAGGSGLPERLVL